MELLQANWVYIAGLVTALGVIGGGLKSIHSIRRHGWQPFKRKLLWWKANREARAKLAGDVKELIGATNRIEAELHTNGGSSLKDFVTSIHSKVEHIQARQRYDDEMSEYASFELDQNGKMIAANAAFCELLDVDEKMLFHRSWWSRVRSGERSLLIRDLLEAIQFMMPLETLLTFNRDDGTTVSLRVKLKPIIRSGGVLTGFFGRADIFEADA